MSGICGVWRRDRSSRAADTIAGMGAALARIRPEAFLVEESGEAAVGISACSAAQQICRADDVLLACDADLTNGVELARTYGNAAGRRIESGSTAALLAGMYERLGPDFIEKLRGGFAVTVWDRRERLFLAAIDGFGIKRLVYYEDGLGVMVSSRVNALAAGDAVDTTINPKAIVNLLNFTSNLGPETIFTKMRRLTPGSALLCTGSGVRVSKYWDMRYAADGEGDEARLSRELEDVVKRSVAANCAGRPLSELGAFLSGGTDSSTVVGIMTGVAQAPVKAFSIGFEEQPFNELSYAAIAAKRFRSEHHTYLVKPRDCYAAIPQLVRCFDEPFGNSSAIPTYFCAKLAFDNGVKTLLAGDGGDELFGGNERYATDKLFGLYQRVPRVLRTGLIEPVAGWLPAQLRLVKRARGYIRRAKMRGVERMLSFQFLYTHPLTEVFEPDFLQSLGEYALWEIPAGHYAQAPGALDHLDRLLYVDMKITLADNDLPKVTCASELAGVRTMFPFLDRDVAELSGRIPPGLKVRGFDKRYLFKRAFRQLLPVEIVRKKKHGFGIPVASWMITDPCLRELTRDTLLSARAFARGYFRRAFLEELFRKQENDHSTYYGDALWVFLMLELWHRQVRDTG